MFFPLALLVGFSFRTGEHKEFAVREMAAKPEKVSILHRNLTGNLPGNVLGTFVRAKKNINNPRYFLLTRDSQCFFFQI